jgi:uncharacterized repeat protein (TIGR01451 family)
MNMRHRALQGALALVLLVAVVGLSPVGTATAEPADEFAIRLDGTRQMRTLDATWHAGAGQFFVVWSEHPSHTVNGTEVHNGNDEIRGRLVALDETLGAAFDISEGGDSKDFPQIAHVLDTLVPAQQVSLVVWSDTRDGGHDIWGQLVNPAGTAKQGSNFKISGADPDRFPGIAYGQEESGSGVFLVVWERETASDDSEVWGRLVQGASWSSPASVGTTVGSSFQISASASGYASAPSVAFDPVTDQFLVTWTDDLFYPSDNTADIYGRFVDINGNPVGTGNFQISSQTGAEGAPQVVFHPEQNEYLVVWTNGTSLSGSTSVYGQRLTSAGALSGGVINIAATASQEGAGEPVVDRETGSYIVPLITGPNVVTRVEVEMAKVSATGTVISREDVATDTTRNKGPAVAVYGSTPIAPGGAATVSEVLIAWRDSRSGTTLLDQNIWGNMVEKKTDTDGDGLLDSWETSGYVDMNDNGVLDAGDFDFSTLPPADRPDVNHKDLYIEVDWMEVDADGDGIFCDSLGNGCDPSQPGDHSHGPLAVAGSLPTGTSFDPVITSFANAPVNNPDGTTGINLHLDLGPLGGGGPSPEVANLDFFAAGAANFEAYKTANFDQARQRVFHYAVMKHEGSGRSEIWGNDFWLGAQYDTEALQALNLMHEFGHNLGLRHGGFENTPNCKPNHLSIMSYAMSTTGIPPTFRPDYSSQTLLPLDESNLDEGVDLGDANDHTGDAIDQTVFSSGGVVVGPNANTAANAPIDWDNDGTGGETGVSVDLNTIPVINGFNACRTATAGETLTGHDDWENLWYNFHSSPNYDDNSHAVSYPVTNFETVKDFWLVQYGEPILGLTKSGPTEGVPGDYATYTIEATNTGDGPARNIVVEDNWPAGLTFMSATPAPLISDPYPGGGRYLLWSFEVLEAGGTLTITVNGTIDFPPVGDEVTQSVTMNGQNVLGQPEATLTDSITTDILFPEMEMSKTATATVNAGEAITYTITYENVGDGDAANVVITDTLPEDE